MRRYLIGGLCAALVSLIVLPPTAAVAAVPPRNPASPCASSTCRRALDTLCTLKPGQTPNVDKLMPAINWTTAADFGFEDHFQSEVIGNINIATAGHLRVPADQRRRLAAADRRRDRHQPRRAARRRPPKEGAVTLTTGYHALRIDHFERGGGQQLTLEWRPPGASAFAVVPNCVLSTDAGVVRVTAPGRKECEGAADTPGDGLPLTGVHPGYTLTNLRPTGFQPQVSAMDWLPGRPAGHRHLGRQRQRRSARSTCSAASPATPSPSQVTHQRIATGLEEPMGLKFVDGKIYVSEKHELTELNDTNGDGVIDKYRTVATWPFGGNFHEFAFGLLYQDGFFYLNLSVSINYGGATTDPQPAPNRGTTIKVNRATGAVHLRRRRAAHPARHRLGPGGRHLRHRQPGRLAARRRSWCTSSRTGSSTTT